ncbi:MAG TPA: group II intron reverse transcriptase/maturase [Candidatus Tectomicrobia bacterium]
MRDTQHEDQPATVATTPTQAGDSQARWAWVERAVWTERMLAALETGVQGGKWFSLMDKVYAPANLAAAWETVRRKHGCGGVDGQSLHAFAARAEQELARLAEDLRTGAYRPHPVKRVQIPKPGSRETRPLGIPTVRDRVAQTALRHVLEPIFERRFRPCSYGFRPGRGCQDALGRVHALLNDGYAWVVDADLEQYFETIPHDRLMHEVEQEVADGRVLEVLRGYLTTGVLDGHEMWTPEQGTPQGAVISPLLANIYLHPVDVAMSDAGYAMVRYADDVVVLCRSEAEAHAALAVLRGLIEGRGLTLHPIKTRIVDVTQRGGFDFLGYHFERGYRWPRKKSLTKLKDAIRAKTRRTSGHSLPRIIVEVNRTVRGWFAYFRHSHPNTFRGLDSWVRMRLRSILRKRVGLRGRSRGQDHQRWPNAFFRDAGLYTMTEARTVVCWPP